MPGPVNLDVRNFSSGGADGYKDVAASNGSTYSYKYTGGDDGHGNVTVHINTHAAITVSLHSDSRYSITDVSFNPNDGQYTWHAGGSAAVAVITQAAARTGDVKYTAIVTDSIAHCTVPCDPVIHNVP